MMKTLVATSLVCLQALISQPSIRPARSSIMDDLTNPVQHLNPVQPWSQTYPRSAPAQSPSVESDEPTTSALATSVGERTILIRTEALGADSSDQALAQGSDFLEIAFLSPTRHHLFGNRSLIGEQSGTVRREGEEVYVCLRVNAEEFHLLLNEWNLSKIKLIISRRRHGWFFRSPRIGAAALNLEQVVTKLLRGTDVSVTVPGGTTVIHFSLKE